MDCKGSEVVVKMIGHEIDGCRTLPGSQTPPFLSPTLPPANPTLRPEDPEKGCNPWRRGTADWSPVSI